MDVYWCGTKIVTLTGAGTTWKNYTDVFPATGSSCTLKLQSMTSGNGGVVPTNVQVRGPLATSAYCVGA